MSRDWAVKIVVPYESLSSYKADTELAKREADGAVEVDALVYASEVIPADEKIAAAKGVSGTLTITTSDWVSNSYTATVEELGENDAIFFTPATREDKTAIEEASVFISTVGNKVTFSCEDAPTAAINFKYFICRGA
jgi:hypothetical protein